MAAFELSAAVLGVATTMHAALGMVRTHRSPHARSRLWSLPSVVLAVSPWFAPGAAYVAAGLFLHLGWVLVYRRLFGGIQADAAVPQPGPLDFVPLKVLSLIDVSPTVRSFRLTRPRGLTFEAGQFLTVRVHVDGKPFMRCYSVSSAPAAPFLQISVKRQGLVSGALHASVRAGAHLFVRLPSGHFTYPSDSRRPIVLIAGGVGITPLISMARHAVASEPWRPVTLLYSAREEEELAFWEDLKHLMTEQPQFKVVATLTTPTEGWAGRVGRLTQAAITECVPAPAEAVYLMCGPAAMLTSLRDTLRGVGVPDHQIRFEIFQPASKLGLSGAGADGTEEGVSHAVTFERSGVTARAPETQVLIEVAEDAGVPIPSLCRAGVCRTCRTRVVSGRVASSSDGSGDAGGDGWILPCVSSARSDCALDA